MSGEDKFEAAMSRALRLVSEAMDLVDAHNGPAEAGAHLAMAQGHLREVLGRRRS